MGMFDNIQCNYPLPVSKELLDVEEFDICEVEFQTKSLENLLELYIISEQGELIRRKAQYEWKNDDSYFLKGYADIVSEEDIKQDFHGVLEFYCYESYLKDDGDKKKEITISVDYEAKFVDGKLTSVHLVDQSITDTTEHYEDMQALWKLRNIEANKWHNKYFFYTKQFRNFKRICIYKPLDALHRLTGKLLTLSYRI